MQIRLFSKGKRNIIIVLCFHVEFQGRARLEDLSTNPTWRFSRTWVDPLAWMGQSYVLVHLQKSMWRIDLAKRILYFVNFTSGIVLRTSLQPRQRNVVFVCLCSLILVFNRAYWYHHDISEQIFAMQTQHNFTCADNAPSSSSCPCPKKPPMKSDWFDMKYLWLIIFFPIYNTIKSATSICISSWRPQRPLPLRRRRQHRLLSIHHWIRLDLSNNKYLEMRREINISQMLKLTFTLAFLIQWFVGDIAINFENRSCLVTLPVII